MGGVTSSSLVLIAGAYSWQYVYLRWVALSECLCSPKLVSHLRYRSWLKCFLRHLPLTSQPHLGIPPRALFLDAIGTLSSTKASSVLMTPTVTVPHEHSMPTLPVTDYHSAFDGFQYESNHRNQNILRKLKLKEEKSFSQRWVPSFCPFVPPRSHNSIPLCSMHMNQLSPPCLSAFPNLMGTVLILLESWHTLLCSSYDWKHDAVFCVELLPTLSVCAGSKHLILWGVDYYLEMCFICHLRSMHC